jgi:hypothetical protein
MLTHEQITHNNEVEQQIKQNELDHQRYLDQCEAQRKEFYANNPDHPIKTLFIPVRARKQVCAIIYVD